MHRPTLGVIAVVLLIGAAWLTFWPPAAGDEVVLWQAAFLRVGSVLAIAWIAHPQLKRIPQWMYLSVILLLVLLALRPKLVVFAVVILVIAAIVRPKRKKTRPVLAKKNPSQLPPE